jgi:hypothetical protein
MRLRWSDVACTTKPVTIPWRDGKLSVQLKHIEIWKQHPNAVFRVTLGGAFTTSSKMYVLGGWEADAAARSEKS